MKLIYQIEANPRLNKKSETLSMLLHLYDGCLFPTDSDFQSFVKGIEVTLQSLNKDYPRTTPFSIYSKTDKYIYIAPDGSPDKAVATIRFATVERLFLTEEDSIIPVENCKLSCTINS